MQKEKPTRANPGVKLSVNAPTFERGLVTTESVMNEVPVISNSANLLANRRRMPNQKIRLAKSSKNNDHAGPLSGKTLWLLQAFPRFGSTSSDSTAATSKSLSRRWL